MAQTVLCRIDGTPVASGGSKTDQLCARCYQRRRRGLDLTPEKGKLEPGESVHRSISLHVMVLAMVERLAQERGISVNEWMREAIQEKIDRE